MFPGNKLKAITFSYDDGVTQDRRLIKLLNKYNLKATFNINSGLYGSACPVKGLITAPHVRSFAPEIKDIYSGHEIAVHTCTHPLLPSISDERVLAEVENDRKALEALCGYDIVGMAYPCGGKNYDERVMEILRSKTPIKYSRTIESNGSFDKQDDLLCFKPTVFHMDLKNLWRLADEFIALRPTEPKLMYIWGHAYEFDLCDTWEEFESFCQYISNRDEIYYGTNKQVLLGCD